MSTTRTKYMSRESRDGWGEAVAAYAERFDNNISMVYILLDEDTWGNEFVVYVGRSDTIMNRTDQHIRAINMFSKHNKVGYVTKVKFCFITGNQRNVHSFYEESLQYHYHGGKHSLRGNSNHPEQPHGRSRRYKCPVCGGGGIDGKNYEHFKINDIYRYRNW